MGNFSCRFNFTNEIPPETLISPGRSTCVGQQEIGQQEFAQTLSTHDDARDGAGIFAPMRTRGLAVEPRTSSYCRPNLTPNESEKLGRVFSLHEFCLRVRHTKGVAKCCRCLLISAGKEKAPGEAAVEPGDEAASPGWVALEPLRLQTFEAS